MLINSQRGKETQLKFSLGDSVCQQALRYRSGNKDRIRRSCVTTWAECGLLGARGAADKSVHAHVADNVKQRKPKHLSVCFSADPLIPTPISEANRPTHPLKT